MREVRMKRRSLVGMASAAAAAAAVVGGYALVVRPWYLRWGATDREVSEPLLGDDVVPRPAFQSTRAVEINAGAGEVWPWLVQIGYGRGGFYSYDWLENVTVTLTGARPHYRSVDVIMPELQHLKVGDFIPSAPPDLFGGRLARYAGWRVAALEPSRALVLQGWGAFVLEPTDRGTIRLIARSRGGGNLAARLVNLAWELPHFIMERKMLLGIKRRAEALASDRKAKTEVF